MLYLESHLGSIVNFLDLQLKDLVDFPVCGFCLQAPSKKKIEINTIASNYHLEVNPRWGDFLTW